MPMSKINLNYYKNQNTYCYYVLNNLDGETIELLKNPDNDEKFIEKNPHLYYYLLSRSNQGLFNWINNLGGEILEITGGVGIHTEILCKKANNVTTVCFSKVNAEIINSRLSDYNNLEIFVGNPNDINFSKKFDFIVLSDILEFSQVLFENAYIFINYLKTLLTKNGIIICAVANKYGIGNYSGCVSHITGQPFDSVNDYPKLPFLHSFTKRETETLFSKGDFEWINICYPLPDHYQNKVILTNKSLDKITIGNKFFTLYKDYGINPNKLVDEFQAVKEAALDNRFTATVNSYLVIAGLSKENKPDVDYAQTQKDILTTLDTRDGNKYCKKTALTENAVEILDKMYNFYLSETNRIKEQGIENIKYARAWINSTGEYSLNMRFAEGQSLNQIGLKILPDYNKFLAFCMEYKSLIRKIYPKAEYKNYTIDNITLENVACVENANIDLNMSNIFRNGDDYTIVDYEKTSPFIPLNYIIAQGIFVLASDSGFAFNETEYLKLLGISEREIKCYQYIYAMNNMGK